MVLNFVQFLRDYVSKNEVHSMILMNLNNFIFHESKVVDILAEISKSRKIDIVIDQYFDMQRLKALVRNLGNVNVISRSEILREANYDLIVVQGIYVNELDFINAHYEAQHIISVEKISDLTMSSLSARYMKMEDGSLQLKKFDSSCQSSAAGGRAKCSFYIVNYNTSDLMNIPLYSIRAFVKSFDYDIWIFDNSDKEKLKLDDSTNVHILDNTNGQLIDYDEAIREYCNVKDTRGVFAGAKGINGFVSLRHILALQYGFTLPDVSDNMIICDSDIVLKKDIDFIDESKALIGTVRLDGYNKRMLPFLCYVNKRLLNKAGVQYFNQLKMRGCKDAANRTIVKYDTGGSVLEDCTLKKLPIKLISIEDYCVHFGGLSREDLSTRMSLNTMFDIDMIKDNLMKHNVFVNAYDYSKMCEKRNELFEEALSKYRVESTGKKYVIYTCITGDYDSLTEQPYYEHDKFDYVCFTNSPSIKHSDNWKIISISGIDKIINESNQQKISRFPKTHPHLFFKNYEKSLYIDGNIKIMSKDLENDFIKFLSGDEYLLTSQHPSITNVYDEIKACVMKRKDDPANLSKIREFLETVKFNDLNAHAQMGIMLRDHNNKECQKIMEDWWWMIKNFCKRDQTSFNYVIWNNRGRFLSLPFDYVKRLFAIGRHSS